ncbi:MAG: hypothetical protein PVH88_17725 [Ignavibacteria bacterium]|jgi:hypothetical protein
MKRVKTISIFILLILTTVATNAQWSVGTDIYTQYIWRGVKYGSGPAVQPWVDFTEGVFSAGAWGSVTYGDDFQEMDLYASVSTDIGLTIGVYDYYYPGTDWFDLSDTAGAHGIELNLGYEIEGLSLSANYIVNEAPGAGTVGDDKYFEVGYSFPNFSVFFGIGDGWHSSDTEMQVVNVGLSTSKEVKISDELTIPVSGAIVLNPDAEQFFVVVGFSL